MLAAAALLTATPAWLVVPHRDSGVFLAVGEGILRGLQPYRDLWDHKPPLAYWIDALGLWLSPPAGGSSWGLWVLEWLSLATATAALGAAVRARLGRGAALVVLVAFPCLVALNLGGGNYTEEWALPGYALGLALLLSGAQGPAVWAGLGACLAWTLGAKLCGLGLGLWAFEQAWRSGRWRGLGYFAAGLGIPAVCVLAWALCEGLLARLVDQVLAYNSVYAQATGWGGRLACLRWFLGAGGVCFVPLALGAVVFGQGARRRLGAVYLLEAAQVLWLGRPHGHYLLVLAPAGALLLGEAASVVAASPVGRWGWVPDARREFWAAFLAAACLFWSGSARLDSLPGGGALKRIEVNRFIATLGRRPVLLWGAEAGLLFGTRAFSPTRFVYQYPLVVRGYTRPAQRRAFSRVLGRVDLVVDASASAGAGTVGRLRHRRPACPDPRPRSRRRPAFYDGPWRPPCWAALLKARFVRVGRVGDWVLYRRRAGKPAPRGLPPGCGGA